MKIIKLTKSIKKRILQAFVKFDIVCVSALLLLRAALWLCAVPDSAQLWLSSPGLSQSFLSVALIYFCFPSYASKDVKLYRVVLNAQKC